MKCSSSCIPSAEQPGFSRDHTTSLTQKTAGWKWYIGSTWHVSARYTSQSIQETWSQNRSHSTTIKSMAWISLWQTDFVSHLDLDLQKTISPLKTSWFTNNWLIPSLHNIYSLLFQHLPLMGKMHRWNVWFTCSRFVSTGKRTFELIIDIGIVLESYHGLKHLKTLICAAVVSALPSESYLSRKFTKGCARLCAHSILTGWCSSAKTQEDLYTSNPRKSFSYVAREASNNICMACQHSAMGAYLSQAAPDFGNIAQKQ